MRAVCPASNRRAARRTRASSSASCGAANKASTHPHSILHFEPSPCASRRTQHTCSNHSIASLPASKVPGDCLLFACVWQLTRPPSLNCRRIEEQGEGQDCVTDAVAGPCALSRAWRHQSCATRYALRAARAALLQQQPAASPPLRWLPTLLRNSSSPLFHPSHPITMLIT